ncbi:hypothetical protein MKW92_037140 [Papaver armeniacum]|nr:hypothetical protein MKW92_037140 [Papaver armeniacum]
MQTPQPLAYLPECQATIKVEVKSPRRLSCPLIYFNTKDFPTSRPSLSSVLRTTFMRWESVSSSPTHWIAPKYSKHECTHIWKPSNSRTCKSKC